MAIFNGTLYKMQYETGTPGTYADFPDQTEGSISLNLETRDTSSKSSSGWRDLAEGQKSGSISLSGLVDDTTSAVTTLFSKFSTRATIGIRFGIDGTASLEDDDVFECDGYVTSIETSAGTEDNVTYSATIEITGAVTHDSTDEPE